MDKFVVSYSPFVRSSNDINKMFIWTAVTLLLPTVFGCVFFGINSLFVVVASVIGCYLSESFFNLISGKKFRVFDLSFLVTGMILGCSLSVKTPIYVVIICGFISCFVVKMVFGGLGKNKLNPALVGRLFAGMFTAKMTESLYTITMNGDVYTSLSQGGENTIRNLLMGNSIGGIGTTCVILILVAYAFLIYMDVIDWKIPLFSMISYLVASIALCGMEKALMYFCSGSFVFVCVFMMTDPNTSPNTFIGKLLYSILFGALSAFVWKLGFIGEDSVFVVALFVNILVPFMDKYLVVKQKPLGGYRYAYKN